MFCLRTPNDETVCVLHSLFYVRSLISNEFFIWELFRSSGRTANSRLGGQTREKSSCFINRVQNDLLASAHRPQMDWNSGWKPIARIPSTAGKLQMFRWQCHWHWQFATIFSSIATPHYTQFTECLCMRLLSWCSTFIHVYISLCNCNRVRTYTRKRTPAVYKVTMSHITCCIWFQRITFRQLIILTKYY